jgi:hypothetical protein
MVVKTFEDFRILDVLGNSKNVLVYEYEFVFSFFDLDEFGTGNAAERAFFGGGVTFVDISAYGASEFSHSIDL